MFFRLFIYDFPCYFFYRLSYFSIRLYTQIFYIHYLFYIHFLLFLISSLFAVIFFIYFTEIFRLYFVYYLLYLNVNLCSWWTTCDQECIFRIILYINFSLLHHVPISVFITNCHAYHVSIIMLMMWS